VQANGLLTNFNLSNANPAPEKKFFPVDVFQLKNVTSEEKNVAMDGGPCS
jgi:hypothetical protein